MTTPATTPVGTVSTPTYITRAQLTVVCEVLGLPVGDTLSIRADNRRVTAVIVMRPGGATCTVDIPVHDGPAADPEAMREMASRLLTAANEAEATA